MIIEIRVNNCTIFENEIKFTMNADMRSSKFSSNVYSENNYNILKVAGIYGQNNVGKTSFVKCVKNIINAMLNKPLDIIDNIFTESYVSDLGITFFYNGEKYSFDFSYNCSTKEFVYEKFASYEKDKYGNEKTKVWYEIDHINKQYASLDKDICSMFNIISKNNILCYLIDTELLCKTKEIITKYANTVDIINMNNIPMKKTIELLKNKSNIQGKIVEFIKKADLYLDDFKYANADEIKIDFGLENEKADEEVLNIPQNIVDQMRLVSVYKGEPVPSVLFDSTGTKKIAALASYIIEGIEQGRVLIVDELDSSIHFKLTRAIVAMYNNELNTNAQLIFTVHDINLMDCKKLFRKEQIWFIHKDNEGIYVYSLADFTAQAGIRDTTDIIEKYSKGVLGALPEPDLIDVLIDIKSNK